MSISTSARPTLFLTGLVNIISNVVNDSEVEKQKFKEMNRNITRLMNEKVSEENLQEIVDETVNIMTKEYETNFADRNLLIKTLEEHGVENIQINGDSLTGKYECFRIDCYREQETAFDSQEPLPFKMRVSADCTEEEINSLIEDINSEYALNTQEENYIKIKERLEIQGLKIDEEEVMEDDVIVLTVNVN